MTSIDSPGSQPGIPVKQLFCQLAIAFPSNLSLQTVPPFRLMDSPLTIFPLQNVPRLKSRQDCSSQTAIQKLMTQSKNSQILWSSNCPAHLKQESKNK